MEVLQELKELRPKLPVLVMSFLPEEQFGVRVLRAGAAGYITKESAADELVKAILAICAGGNYISNSLRDGLVSAVQTDSTKPPHESLSDRDFKVLQLIASGKTVGEIAELLLLSVKTISTYRARVLDRMHMNTNAELTH